MTYYDDGEQERRYLPSPPPEAIGPRCRTCGTATPMLHGCFDLKHDMPDTVESLEQRIEELEEQLPQASSYRYEQKPPPAAAAAPKGL